RCYHCPSSSTIFQSCYVTLRRYCPTSFFFHAPSPAAINTLSLHDALPISCRTTTCGSTSSTSTGAEVPRATPRSGAAERIGRSGQHRSWHSRTGRLRRTGRAGAVLLGAGMLLTGCTGADRTAEPTASAPGSTSTQAAADAGALGTACATFWGDPEYIDPLSRTVLAQAASAPEIGPSDPGFYALTGDEVDTAFEGAPTQARQAAGALSDWFRTEPERGAEADLEAFPSAYEGLASSCRETSAAARWAVAPGKDGTKPAALVCADVFDTPGTLTHFANANVLTSNMFKLVGLSPREVPAGREQDVRDTADLLSAEIAAVDDEA